MENEKERLEDIQLENFEQKRIKSIKKTHERLEKLKKIESKNNR